MGSTKSSASSMVSNGLKVKGLRKQNGYSIEKFAQMIGSSRSSLWRYEAGQRRIPEHIAQTLKSKYKLSLSGYSYGKSYKSKSTWKKHSVYDSLKQLQESLGMTTLEFCSKFNLSPSSLTFIKKDSNYNLYLSVNSLQKLSKVIDLNKLFN